MIQSSYSLRVKPNATYLAHFLVVLQKVLKKNRNSHYEIIKKIKIESMIEFILSKVTCISWSRPLLKTNIIPCQHQEF